MVSTFEPIVNFGVPNIVVIGVVIINNHVQTIPIQIGKNISEDVLIDMED